MMIIMITKIIDDNAISIIAEDADDLLNLRRVIKVSDRIIGDTTRVIKQDKEYSRPDRGERIKIRVSLQIEKILFDSVVDKLRVSGIIIESNNQAVPHGSHHSMLLNINEPFTISKKRWSSIEKKIIQRHDTGKQTRFFLVAIDKTDCGIGQLRGTHLKIMPNIYSEYSGKRYKTNFNIEKFFDEISRVVISTVRDQHDKIIIFGPGETKKKFMNFLQKVAGSKKSLAIELVDGIDSGGEDGIYIFTKSDTMKVIMANSKIAKIAGIIDDIMIMATKQSKKFTMGFQETQKANEQGAIESLIFSDKAIQTNEKEIIEFLNSVEANGGEVFSVDSSTDLGLRVTGLGGIISVLRFAISSN